MKNKQFVLFLFLCTALHLASYSQIAFGVAKDENRSAIDYKVEWGYTYSYQAQNAADKYLKNKGYKDISSPAVGGNIPSGYYVVVKSSYKDYQGKIHTSMGMGVSPATYVEAEQKAVENIGTYDWSWKKGTEYIIVEKGEFNSKGGLQCVYIIDKVKNGDCSDYATKYNIIIGTMDKRLYDNMKKGIESKCVKNNLPVSETGRFRITKRYIAVLKCLQVCATDNKAYPQYKFVEADSPGELSTIAPLSKGQLFYGSGYGYFLQQLIDLQDENSSPGAINQLTGYLRSVMNPSELMSVEEGKGIRWVAIGIRD